MNALILLALFLILIVFWQRRHYYWLHFQMPSIAGYPLMGVIPLVKDRDLIFDWFGKAFVKYGSVFFAWLGPIPFVVVSDPQTTQEIFNSNCISKGAIYGEVADAVGHGLFTMEGDEWSINRRMLNPAFTAKTLTKFVPIFNAETRALMENLDDMVGKGGLDFTKPLQLFTMKMTMRTTIGTSMKCDKSTIEMLFNDLMRMLDTIADRMTRPWLYMKSIRKLLSNKYTEKNHYESKIREYIKTELNKVIENRMVEETEANIGSISDAEKNVFINLTCNYYQRNDFTMQQVNNHCLNIFFGAFESTSAAVHYVLILLAMHPQYQEKVFEEIKSVFPDLGDFEATSTDITELKYLDMVINETLRLMPPVPLLAREAIKEFKLSNGIVVPKGVRFAVSIYHIHRNPDIWGPNAHAFNPENFLPSNMENKHPYSFLPFSKGRRICIGSRYALLSLKITLTKLLRNYRFVTKSKFEDLMCIWIVSLKLKQSPLLEIHRRES